MRKHHCHNRIYLYEGVRWNCLNKLKCFAILHSKVLLLQSYCMFWKNRVDKSLSGIYFAPLAWQINAISTTALADIQYGSMQSSILKEDENRVKKTFNKWIAPGKVSIVFGIWLVLFLRRLMFICLQMWDDSNERMFCVNFAKRFN